MSEAEWISEWFKKAAEDLLAANHMFYNMQPRLLEIACYHCQQAVEKALKGFLIVKGIEPPKTHNLNKLCLMCMEYDQLFGEWQDTCRELTAYAASTRYPDCVEITDEDTYFAIEEADEIYKFCASLAKSLQSEEEVQEVQEVQEEEEEEEQVQPEEEPEEEQE